MPVRAGDLEVVANLRDEVSGKLDTIEGKAGALAGKFAVAGAAVTAFAAVAGRDFDRAKTTIVQGTGATGEALDGLLASFQNLAGTISGADNQAVAGALADLNTKFRVTGPALESLATNVLQAKQAFGEFDIDTFGQSMRLFGIETGGAGAFLDHFGTVAQDTGVPMGELIRQTQVYGPAMKNLGLGANETAAFFGKLHESGVDVRRVMPGLDLAMQKAAKGGVTDLRGHLDDAIKSIRNAETDTEALTLASATFGSEGAGRISAAIRTGILPSLADLDTQYENTEGRTQAAYEATVTLGDRLAMLKDRALALVGPMGDAAAGVGALATGAVLAGPSILKMGGSIGTKLLPLLAGPAGLIALLGVAVIGIKAFYDSMARKEVDEFAESIGAMTEKVKGQTKAHLENVIAVSKARLENREFSSQYAVIRDQLETAEAKLALLTETTEEHTEAVVEQTVATVESTKAVEKAEDSWKEWTAEVDRLSAQMDLAKRINEEMMSSLTRESEVAIEDVIGQFGRLGPEAFDPIEPGLVAPTSKATAEMNKTFQQGIDKAIDIVSTGLDLAGQKGAANFLRRISSMVSTALSMISRIQGLLGSSAGGAGAAGAGAGAGAGLGLGAVGGAAALGAAAYGVGRVATGIIDTVAGGRYPVEEIERRFPLAGQGGGTPTPPDQHIHINIDGQEVASVVARRLPGVADEEGW